MTKDKQHINVPHLRFPEFTGEWKKVLLGQIANITKGNGISKEQLSDQGTPCILYGELYTKYKSEIINEIYSKTTLNSSALVKSQANDVIIPCSGETAIDISTARCVPYNDVLLGGDLNIIRLKSQNGGFFAYQLNGVRKHDIACIAQGVSVVHLYGENLKRIKVCYPSIEEQRKITSLLSLIDERIATQNKIIKKLETLIKALSHKLTTQKKPNTLLKNCLVCHSSTLLESHVKGKGQYPVFGATGICGYTDKSDISGDSILIIKDGAGVGTTTYATGKYSVIGTLNYLQSTQEHYSLLYIYYSLKTFDFRPYITGMAIPHIYFRDYGKAKIWCPDIVEQKRIATVLRTMDAKLKINHSILRNLTLQKQYLLSNLFI
ncbi:restriction endonuclease subunit S [uncultured Alistipes sp.]|uniref:restriction endonuclease subunit S n=1 Tax=uncultured Alistipes sp. TaxID=538949 RepID=UPI00259BDEFB|nr:restriction endonuclease subunit S [uncultured Alistipes sp.]